jgi:5-methylcytosine-specific restriction endonuclease McrA
VGRIYSKTDESRLRSRYAWTKKAKQIKDDANGLCEVCKAQGVYTYDGLEVHHIQKLKDNPNGLLEDDNLITLCVYHHKQADDGEIDVEYLKKLVKVRRGLVND